MYVAILVCCPPITPKVVVPRVLSISSKEMSQKREMSVGKKYLLTKLPSKLPNLVKQKTLKRKKNWLLLMRLVINTALPAHNLLPLQLHNQFPACQHTILTKIFS